MAVNKYHLWVLGCAMNQADAERIDKILKSLSWQKVEREDEADLIVVVACSVKQAAINRIAGKGFEWRKRRQAGKLKVILTGCVLDDDKKKLDRLFDAIMPIGEIGRLPEIISSEKNDVTLAEFNSVDYLSLPAAHATEFSALVPISNGCNNYCAYCAVPYARGREVSREAQEIIAECRSLIESGCKEITLLGQNVNSYFDCENKINFPTLLKMIDGIEGDYWLRFMSSHPKDLTDELIETMAACRHLVPHLHLAVQSGSDEVLLIMNRRYTAKHYAELVGKIRNKIPGLMVSTDIIVGFPGETQEHFAETEKLMRELKFDMAYISPYSPRAGTAAEKLTDDVMPEEKKIRVEKLNEILRQTALENSRQHLGRTVRVLVDKCVGGECHGKTATAKTVVFSDSDVTVGKFVDILIKEADNFALRG